METIGWHRYDDRTGKPTGYSKQHLIETHGQETVCGIRIPGNVEIGDGYSFCSPCKKCYRYEAAKASLEA